MLLEGMNIKKGRVISKDSVFGKGNPDAGKKTELQHYFVEEPSGSFGIYLGTQKVDTTETRQDAISKTKALNGKTGDSQSVENYKGFIIKEDNDQYSLSKNDKSFGRFSSANIAKTFVNKCTQTADKIKAVRDSYSYKGTDYSKEDLWKLLVKEGKTKRFKELTEAQQDGRTDQYALLQSGDGGLYAIVRDSESKDISSEQAEINELNRKIVQSARQYSRTPAEQALAESWVRQRDDLQRKLGQKGQGTVNVTEIRAGSKRSYKMPYEYNKDEEPAMVGKHNDVPDDQFDSNELQMGIEEEKEHSDSEEIAKSIAKDHLVKTPDYYSRLKKSGVEKTTDAPFNKKDDKEWRKWLGEQMLSVVPRSEFKKYRYEEIARKAGLNPANEDVHKAYLNILTGTTDSNTVRPTDKKPITHAMDALMKKGMTKDVAAKETLKRMRDSIRAKKKVKIKTKDTTISVKCTYADGNIITTGFNGSLVEAKKYFEGKSFNFGDTEEHPKDKMVKCVKVELLGGGDSKTKDDETITMECNECNKKFRKTLSPESKAVKCPSCGGTNTEPVTLAKPKN